MHGDERNSSIISSPLAGLLDNDYRRELERDVNQRSGDHRRLLVQQDLCTDSCPIGGAYSPPLGTANAFRGRR